MSVTGSGTRSGIGPNSEEVRGPQGLKVGPQVGQIGTSSGESLGSRENDLYVICFKAIIYRDDDITLYP